MATMVIGKQVAFAQASQAVYFKANKVYYDQDNDIAQTEGGVRIYHQGKALRADKLTLDLANDLVYATGNIHLQNDKGEVISGHQVLIKQSLKAGLIAEFAARLDSGATGDAIIAARLAKRDDETHYRLYKSVYSPCKLYCGGRPIWQINAEHAKVNLEDKEVKYENVFFAVFGQPVFYLPYFSHPTPDAESSSGLLVPHAKSGTYIQPIYLRLQPNADITISPYINDKYLLSEYEMRYLTAEGGHQINGSFGNPKDLNVNKKYRYHFFGVGDFSKQNWHYGYDLNLTSDKSFLKNYMDVYDSHLASNIYLRQIKNSDYISAEGYYFQGLNAEATFDAGPLVLPKLKTKKIIPLRDDGLLDLTVRSHVLGFKELNQKEISRTGASFLLSSSHVNPLGQKVNFGILNKFDYYMARYKNINNQEKEKTIFRHIPELQSAISWPFLVSNSKRQAIIIEPVVSFAYGKKFRPRKRKIAEFAVDQPDFEISNHNLFNTNKFAGRDFHEFGTRVNYGANLRFDYDKYHVRAFMGQAAFRNNVVGRNRSEFVGQVGSSYGSDFFIEYNFRRNNAMRPILDEVNASLKPGIIGLNLQYFFFNTELKDNVVFDDIRRRILRFQPKLKQASGGITLNLGDNLIAKASSRFDIRDEKWKILSRTMSVTYNLDCVSITAKVQNDYTADQVRGIRKDARLGWRSLSFAVGLRFLNF